MKKFFLSFLIFFQLTSAEKIYDIITLANGFADYFLFVSDEDCKKLGFEKGSWQAVTDETWQKLYHQFPQKAPMRIGGSGMNVIKGAAYLGKKCACIGKLGSDEIGKAYEKTLSEIGITSYLEHRNFPTGKALCFVTEDSERTMRTYRGAAQDKMPITLKPEYFKKSRLFHIEGYQIKEWDNLHKACAMAKKEGVTISLDLGNYFLVEQYKAHFQKLIETYVDILFANESEALAFTGKKPQVAAQQLQKLCDIAVVTQGEKGGWVAYQEKVFHFPAITANPVDTTGAGDLFVSGFLSAFLDGKSLKKSAITGATVASHVIRYIGSDIPSSSWKKIAKQINEPKMLERHAVFVEKN